jgi:hypothetical protein
MTLGLPLVNHDIWSLTTFGRLPARHLRLVPHAGALAVITPTEPVDPVHY